MVARSKKPRVAARKKRLSRGDEVVQAVLAATRGVLAEHGFAALRIEDVAARAKVNKTTIYRRWPAKNQLVAAAAVSAGPAVASVPDTGALESDLRQFLRIAAIELQKDLGRGMLNLLVVERSHPDVAEIVHTVDGYIRALPRVMFERAVARGEIGAEIDIDVALGALLGAMYTRIVMEEKPIDARFIEQLTRLVMRGVGRQPSPRRRAR